MLNDPTPDDPRPLDERVPRRDGRACACACVYVCVADLAIVRRPVHAAHVSLYAHFRLCLQVRGLLKKLDKSFQDLNQNPVSPPPPT